MASLQEINAKRKELMGTGQFANEKEAAVAARNQLTPTPVTPSPTLTTNQAQLAENQAKRQEMIQSGSVPAPATSPTTPTPTQVTTPSTPAPVETPAPVAPVTPAPVDKSAEIKAKNEAQMGINQQKAQLAEQARQKGIDEQNAALANSEGAILNTLKTGGIIPESVKTSTYYKSAQQTYNQLQRYSTYSTNELVTAMNQGSIVPGTSVFNEMMKDPVMKQKISDAQIYRAATPVNTVQVYEEASSNILADNPNTANYLSDGVITLDEYNQATNNTSVMAKAQEVEEKANKYNTIKAEYDSIEDEVKAQFPASPFADSIIADRQKAKYKNLVLAKGEWETATGTLTELKSQAANLFETNLGLYQEQKKTSEAYKMANYQAQLGLQTKGAEMQMESDFAKKKAAEALNDPQTAITNMMEEYKKLGIPFSESIQTKVATAEDFIAKGGTLAGYLDKMQKDIQAKPEFQRYQALQQGQLSDREKMQAQQDFDIQKIRLQDSMKDKNIQRVGGTDSAPIYGYIDGNKIVTVNVPTNTTTNSTATGNIVPVTVGNKTVRLDQSGATGFESAITQLASAGIPIVVGQGARDQSATIKEMADRYGIPFNESNPAETAQKLRSAGHQVADPGKSNHETGMAIDVYGSSKLDAVTPAQEKILNANGWYSSGIPGDAGHFEYKGVQGTGTQGTTFTATEEAWANNIMNGKAKISDITTKDNVDKGKVLQLMNQKTGGTTGTMQTNIQTGLEVVNSLLNHPGLEATVGAPSLFTNPFGYSLPASDARDFKAELKRMEAIGFLNMIPQMQGMGALSNAEGGRLAAAYSKLSDTGIGEDQYKAELTRLKEGMEKALKNMGAIIPEQPKQTPQKTVGGELDYSKYE